MLRRNVAKDRKVPGNYTQNVTNAAEGKMWAYYAFFINDHFDTLSQKLINDS